MTNDDRTTQNESIPAVFFDRTFDETLALLLEAQGYLTFTAASERGGMSLLDSLRMSCEISRMTTRLCEIMAWLLVQKAVHAGELTEEEAVAEEHRLANRNVCLDDTSDTGEVPSGLEGLLDRSRRLYVRVSNLDDMAARRCGATPAKRPTFH